MIELDTSFSVPSSLDQAWRALLDVERIAPCIPGARLETVCGDEFEGSFKVKLGVTAITYRGKAKLVQRDAHVYRAAFSASAREGRANGSATAALVFSLAPADGGTEVSVLTSLDVTGTAAQLGPGVLARVAERLTGQFADRLREELASGEPGAPADEESSGISHSVAGLPDPGTGTSGEPPAGRLAAARAAVARAAAARAAAARRSGVKRAAIAAGVAGAVIVLIRAVISRGKSGLDNS